MSNVCICVFGIIVLNIFFERWFWELKMLTGSLVELYAWLHSYLCFSLLEKRFLNYLDTYSTPGYLSSFQTFSYYNLDKSSTTRWIDQESSWTLDSWWTDQASLLVSLLCSSSPPRQLQLSTLFSPTPSSIDGSTPFDTSICWELLKLYILVCHDPILISTISLDLFAPIHLPNTFFSL